MPSRSASKTGVPVCSQFSGTGRSSLPAALVNSIGARPVQLAGLDFITTYGQAKEKIAHLSLSQMQSVIDCMFDTTMQLRSKPSPKLVIVRVLWVVQQQIRQFGVRAETFVMWRRNSSNSLISSYPIQASPLRFEAGIIHFVDFGEKIFPYFR